MFYFIRTPGWLKKLYPSCIWQMDATEKIIYLTFDDGPHPAITPFVLDTLKDFQAKATFFCIGKNVVNNPEVYKRMIEEGHAVGNHTFNHLNGWKTPDKIYMDDILKAKKYIDSFLFRPPYGRISPFQLRLLAADKYQMRPVMWTVLSGDFDVKLHPDQCLKNVLAKTRPGSIVVFHDSEKANPRMSKALPEMLKFFTEQGYQFKKIRL